MQQEESYVKSYKLIKKNLIKELTIHINHKNNFM